MVFSPDKRLMASAHGDHNVYVSRVSDGGCVRVLTGHPRSPWCVAFHPSRDGILVSTCTPSLILLTPNTWEFLYLKKVINERG